MTETETKRDPMKNQPGPVAPQHQQVASTSSEVQEIDFTPDAEPFDQEQVTREIWDAIHPS